MFLFLAAGLALATAAGALAQTAAPAQAQAPAQSAAAPTASIRGHIADPTGALIPGATVTVTNAAGSAGKTTKADAQGVYFVGGLAPGSYIVSATVDGFASFTSQPIALAAGQIKRVDISMAVAVEQQSITVSDDAGPTVSVDAGSNASAIVLKDKDLEALSDDPDELQNELTALAGPSAGPNGGQIYIDGFTGGQLPPKSAIREIRINQNPFSAEFDKLGYGRIEILTKPGSDKMHGQAFVQGNDDSFNTGNPYSSQIPAYHTIQFNGTVSGALSKTASFFLSAEQRNIQNVSLIYGANGTATGGLLNPHTRTNIAPRLDLQLGEKNTLTLRYQFYRDAESGELGSTQQSSTQAQSSTSLEHTVQLSDSYILNEHAVNETRVQYLHDATTTTGAGGMPQISDVGYFTGGGGAASQINDYQDHLEFQNITTMSAGRHAIKFGTRLRDNRDNNATDANFNGTFTFASKADATPLLLTYTTGSASATVNSFDAALFLQDDWKANKNLTVSGGLRWESQNHISDHNDWAPRAAFAYALDGHKTNKPKTVLRGGYGIFYDRLAIADILAATRFSGIASAPQQQTTIYNPTCFSSASLADALAQGCGGTGSTTLSVIDQIAPNYRSPYTGQLGTSVERQVTKAASLTVTYLHSYGVHQLVTRDANAPTDPNDLDTSRPNGSLENINQYYPEAIFKQNQMIVNVNARLSPTFSLMGFYNLTYANSDGGAGSVASNAYNLMQDYGRATFASRNMVFLMANYQAKWGIRFNPFLIAQSGRPFNVVSNQDPLQDGFFNHRPAFAADASSCSAGSSAEFVTTAFGCLDMNAADNSLTPIPFNLGSGPAAVAVNLRVSRAFGIGPRTEGTNNAGGPPSGGGPGGPGGGRGGHGGGPGGGLGPGGLGGGPGGGMRGMFGPTNTGRKYSLTFNVQALNLFNDIDRGTPLGTVVPTQTTDASGNTTYTPGSLFGQSTNLAGGIFSSGAAARRVFVQAVFSF